MVLVGVVVGGVDDVDDVGVLAVAVAIGGGGGGGGGGDVIEGTVQDNDETAFAAF